MDEASPATLFLIDGTSNIFRAFYAVRGLSSPTGHPTNATFGFTQMLRKLLQDHRPDFLAVAFDRPEPTLRQQRYAEYKANRQAPPEDLVAQIPDIRRVCEILGVPGVERPGYEADDIIGTLASRAAAEGLSVVVVSSDKDLLQLVDDRIRVLHPTRGEMLDAEGVVRTFGVLPTQVVEVLALMGDASDNVPGVPGIGEKGARELIRTYGTVEGCLEHVGEITRRTYRENLERHRDQARLSRELVTIQRDVPIPWDLDQYRRREVDVEDASRFFGELGFSQLAQDLAGAARPTRDEAPGPPASPTRRVSRRSELDPALEALGSPNRLVLIPRWSRPEPMEASLLGLAVGGPEDATWYFDLASGPPDAPEPLTEADLLEALRGRLEDPAVEKIGTDLKSLQVYLLRRGFRWRGWGLDSGLAAYLLDAEQRDYSLGRLASGYLGAPPAAPTRASRRTGKDGGEPLTEDPARGAGQDCRTLASLAAPLLDRLQAEHLEPLYRDVELPLLTVLAEMEVQGVRVDVPFLGELATRWRRDLQAMEEKIHVVAGEPFNINSPPQLRRILFERLGLKPGRKTEKEKSFSTGVDVLEELADDHPLPSLILEYRSLAKLLSTYVEALPALVHPQTGRVHTSFNQTAAATGRLSSSNPNLQNIPIRTEQGRQIRRAFVAEPGWRIIAADYSQIELRVLAHLSGDEEMIRAFQAGEDIHTRTAAQIFSVSGDLVSGEMRRQAKAINFGILYGMGPMRLAREIGVSVSAARRIIEEYFRRFAGVARYVEGVVAAAVRDGRVSTLLGRFRPVPEIQSRNAVLRRQGERIAVNTAIQGTAADLIKLAMVGLARRLETAGLRSRLILQVHDELLLEAPEAEVAEAGLAVRECMESSHPLSVPLVAEVRAGSNWLEGG